MTQVEFLNQVLHCIRGVCAPCGRVLLVCAIKIVIVTAITTTSQGQTTVEDQLADLIRATDKVRSQVNSKKSMPGLSPSTRSFGPVLATPPPDPAKRAREIRERLKVLRQLRLSKAKSAAEKQAAEGAAPTPPPQFSPDAGNPRGSTSGAASSNPGSTATIQDIENSLSPRPSQDPAVRDALSLSATQVLPVAVDHLQLGQSLYETKNYSAALKALQAVDKEIVTKADRNWCELLIALCNRRLGNSADSEASLRDLANKNSGDLTEPIARWWLKQSEATSSAREQLDAIENQLAPLIQRANEYGQP